MPYIVVAAGPLSAERRLSDALPHPAAPGPIRKGIQFLFLLPLLRAFSFLLVSDLSHASCVKPFPGCFWDTFSCTSTRPPPDSTTANPELDARVEHLAPCDLHSNQAGCRHGPLLVATVSLLRLSQMACRGAETPTFVSAKVDWSHPATRNSFTNF
jgi:hypothetical protein